MSGVVDLTLDNDDALPAKPTSNTQLGEAIDLTEDDDIERTPQIITFSLEPIPNAVRQKKVREITANAFPEIIELEPVENTVKNKQPEKPVENTAENAVKNHVEKRAESAVENHVEETVENAVEKHVEKTVEKAAEKPVEKIAEMTAESPVEASVEKPANDIETHEEVKQQVKAMFPPVQQPQVSNIEQELMQAKEKVEKIRKEEIEALQNLSAQKVLRLEQLKTKMQDTVRRQMATTAVEESQKAREAEEQRNGAKSVAVQIAAQLRQERQKTEKDQATARNLADEAERNKGGKSTGVSLTKSIKEEYIPWSMVARGELEYYLELFGKKHPKLLAEAYMKWKVQYTPMYEMKGFSTAALRKLYHLCATMYPNLFERQKRRIITILKPLRPNPTKSSRAAAVYIRKFAQVFPGDFALLFPQSAFAVGMQKLNWAVIQHGRFVMPRALSMAARMYLQELASRFPIEYRALIGSAHFSPMQRMLFDGNGPLPRNAASEIHIHPEPSLVPCVPTVEDFQASLDDVLNQEAMVKWKNLSDRTIVEPILRSSSEPDILPQKTPDFLTDDLRKELKGDTSHPLAEFRDTMNWQSVIHFLLVFRDVLGLASLFKKPSQIENAILHPTRRTFITILERLLQGSPVKCAKVRDDTTAVRALRKDACSRFYIYSEDEVLFEGRPSRKNFIMNAVRSLKSTSLDVRIAILHSLICWTAENSKEVRWGLRTESDRLAARLNPVGTDTSGRQYYHLRCRLDSNCYSPIILEGTDESALRCLTTSVEGMFRLGKELGKSSHWMEVLTSMRINKCAEVVKANLELISDDSSEESEEDDNIASLDDANVVLETFKGDNALENSDPNAILLSHGDPSDDTKGQLVGSPFHGDENIAAELDDISEGADSDAHAPTKPGATSLENSTPRVYHSSDSDFDPKQIDESFVEDDRVPHRRNGRIELAKPLLDNGPDAEPKTKRLSVRSTPEKFASEIEMDRTADVEAVEPVSSSEDERNKRELLKASERFGIAQTVSGAVANEKSRHTTSPMTAQEVGMDLDLVRVPRMPVQHHPVRKPTHHHPLHVNPVPSQRKRVLRSGSKKLRGLSGADRSDTPRLRRSKRTRSAPDYTGNLSDESGRGQWRNGRLRNRNMGRVSYKAQSSEWSDAESDENAVRLGNDAKYIDETIIYDSDDEEEDVNRNYIRRRRRRLQRETDKTRELKKRKRNASTQLLESGGPIPPKVITLAFLDDEVLSSPVTEHITEERKRQLSIMRGKNVFDDTYYENLRNSSSKRRRISAHLKEVDYISRLKIPQQNGIKDENRDQENGELAGVVVSDVEVSSSESDTDIKPDRKPMLDNDYWTTRRKTMAIIDSVKKARKESVVLDDDSKKSGAKRGIHLVKSIWKDEDEQVVAGPADENKAKKENGLVPDVANRECDENGAHSVIEEEIEIVEPAAEKEVRAKSGDVSSTLKSEVEKNKEFEVLQLGSVMESDQETIEEYDGYNTIDFAEIARRKKQKKRMLVQRSQTTTSDQV